MFIFQFIFVVVAQCSREQLAAACKTRAHSVRLAGRPHAQLPLACYSAYPSVHPVIRLIPYKYKLTQSQTRIDRAIDFLSQLRLSDFPAGCCSESLLVGLLLLQWLMSELIS